MGGYGTMLRGTSVVPTTPLDHLFGFSWLNLSTLRTVHTAISANGGRIEKTKHVRQIMYSVLYVNQSTRSKQGLHSGSNDLACSGHVLSYI